MFYRTVAINSDVVFKYSNPNRERHCTLELQGGWFNTFRINIHFSDETESVGRNVGLLNKYFPEYVESFLGMAQSL